MIGVFDSGIGGLTVVRALMQEIPSYTIAYFGDTARTPYGSKSRQTVIQYALEDSEFLMKQGAKIIVIACNTASSAATEILMENFPLPIFEVISPAVELAVQSSKRLRIGVIGTRATIASGIYEKKIREIAPRAKVYSVPCPLLVPLVEEGWLNKSETRIIVKKYLHPLKEKQIDTLILGCTHYPILKDIIQHKIGKRVTLIDSSLAVANKIKNFLRTHPAINTTMVRDTASEFFVSDVTPQFEKTAEALLKKHIRLESIRL
jgi:glutamate racemase